MIYAFGFHKQVLVEASSALVSSVSLEAEEEELVACPCP
jgi:hypothetical protein